MHEEKHLNLVKEITNYLNSAIIPQFEEFNKQNLKYISENIKIYDSWNKKTKELKDISSIFSVTADLHRQLENLIKNQISIVDQKFAFSVYSQLEEFLSQQANKFEDELILEQEEIHFDPKEGRSLLVRIGKRVKSSSFNTGKFLSKIFTKNKENYSWKRKVPYKNLASHYFIHNYLNKFLKNTEIFLENVGLSFMTLLNEQKRMDQYFINDHFKFLSKETNNTFEDIFSNYMNKTEELKSNCDNYIETLSKSLSDIVEKEYELFSLDFTRVGTLELAKRKYSSKKLSNELFSQKKKYERSQNNYRIFFESVFDRLEFYEDLLWFGSILLSKSDNIEKYNKKFLEDKIQPYLKKITEQINNSLSGIDKEAKDLVDFLENEIEEIKNEFDQNLLPKLINQVTLNEVSKVLSEFSTTLENNINEFEKDYNFVKPDKLVYRIEEDQLKKFSPKEVISPIILKKLSYSIKKIDNDFTNKLSKLNTTIIGLARIVEYNLDSAKIKFEEAADRDESIKIAKEGLLRTLNKSKDYEVALNNSFKEVHQTLKNEVTLVLDDLLSLSNIDKLITIKLQVTKEKAVQEVKENIRNYYNKATAKLSKAKNWGLNFFTQSKERIAGISSKVGLGSSSVELSEAMADYLVRVSESLNKLPYVYQRLFSSDQLKDERIFVGREQETAKLEKAIGYWLNNQISSVMLIGEKGSGTSSMINIVLKKFNLENMIYRKEFSHTIFKVEELLKAFEKILQVDNLKSVDRLIDHINGFEGRSIIVIENVEDFFLRIVDGFEALTKLLEIITSTNHKVLWITTCNVHSWDYLKRIINLNEYFIFNIKMGDLNQNIITNIILDRHNISGYDLVFIPTEEIEKQKPYKKANETQRQEILKQEYFERMSKLSSNNIAVALFLWLRSIVNSNDETIEVSLDIELDFSFLNALSDKKMFSLMAIILHDGLTIEEHSLIFNMSHKSTQLLFATLSDDGIIFCKDSIYRINFQLYKPIINILKDKNILH